MRTKRALLSSVLFSLLLPLGSARGGTRLVVYGFDPDRAKGKLFVMDLGAKDSDSLAFSQADTPALPNDPGYVRLRSDAGRLVAVRAGAGGEAAVLFEVTDRVHWSRTIQAGCATCVTYDAEIEGGDLHVLVRSTSNGNRWKILRIDPANGRGLEAVEITVPPPFKDFDPRDLYVSPERWIVRSSKTSGGNGSYTAIASVDRKKGAVANFAYVRGAAPGRWIATPEGFWVPLDADLLPDVILGRLPTGSLKIGVEVTSSGSIIDVVQNVAPWIIGQEGRDRIQDLTVTQDGEKLFWIRRIAGFSPDAPSTYSVQERPKTSAPVPVTLFTTPGPTDAENPLPPATFPALAPLEDLVHDPETGRVASMRLNPGGADGVQVLDPSGAQTLVPLPEGYVPVSMAIVPPSRGRDVPRPIALRAYPNPARTDQAVSLEIHANLPIANCTINVVNNLGQRFDVSPTAIDIDASPRFIAVGTWAAGSYVASIGCPENTGAAARFIVR